METETEKLRNRLVDKSIEAFIMGLEIYNKPTIKYRIEGFSFFICNAWELMLKAELLNRKISIYFKDKPDRTISLEKTVSLIFTNKNGGLRKNLEHIIELRNTSTHFITEDYEYIYAPLFQMCVHNFVDKIKDFHNIDITEHIAQNFLALSLRIEHLTEKEIKSKYTKEMAERLLKEQNKINLALQENNSNFAIPVQTNFYITKKINEADFTIAVDRNSENRTSIIKEIHSNSDIYTLTYKDIVTLVNKRLKRKNIKLKKKRNNIIQYEIFNRHDLTLFINFYTVKQDERYCYYFKNFNAYRYKSTLVDFILEIIEKDSENFISNLKKA